MGDSMRPNYLETEIMTSTPQKLRLMLIEGAIRNIDRTRSLWGNNQDDIACETLIRSQEIMAELLASLNWDTTPELAKKIGNIYLFILQNLHVASIQHDEKRLADVLKVLEEERRTWQEVCDNLAKNVSSENEAGMVTLSDRSATPHSDAARKKTTPPPPYSMRGGMSSSESFSSGLSLEA